MLRKLKWCYWNKPKLLTINDLSHFSFSCTLAQNYFPLNCSVYTSFPHSLQPSYTLSFSEALPPWLRGSAVPCGEGVGAGWNLRPPLPEPTASAWALTPSMTWGHQSDTRQLLPGWWLPSDFCNHEKTHLWRLGIATQTGTNFWTGWPNSRYPYCNQGSCLSAPKHNLLFYTLSLG